MDLDPSLFSEFSPQIHAQFCENKIINDIFLSSLHFNLFVKKWKKIIKSTVQNYSLMKVSELGWLIFFCKSVQPFFPILNCVAKYGLNLDPDPQNCLGATAYLSPPSSGKGVAACSSLPHTCDTVSSSQVATRPLSVTWTKEVITGPISYAKNDTNTGLWIRIHFLRIRIQLFFSMRILIQIQLKQICEN